jgi:chemotaxis protein methyltransferase CheR
MLTNEQFDRTRRLALRLAGIELHERHRDLLYRRCCRRRMENPAHLDALLNAAEASDPNAGRRLVNLVTTNFTGFFRHPWHFDIASEHALWAAHRRGNARLWCAAAATGEEPYSLAMALVELFGHDDPPVSILGTDIDEDALDVAKQGEYSDATLESLARERQTVFFHKTNENGRRHVSPSLRELVEFRALNLVDAEWHVEGLFDVIFCRNVIMYLEGKLRRAVLERLIALLQPNGLLILDPAENPGAAERWLTSRTKGLYQVRRTAVEAARRSGRSNS